MVKSTLQLRLSESKCGTHLKTKTKQKENFIHHSSKYRGNNLVFNICAAALKFLSYNIIQFLCKNAAILHLCTLYSNLFILHNILRNRLNYSLNARRIIYQRQSSLTCLPVKRLGKLVDRWWYLQSLNQDSPLTLKTNILWPADKAGYISLGLDVVTFNRNVKENV